MKDRISSLPDEILTHILSFLLTKEAVATCALSKRWEYIWTRVPVIDLSELLIQLSLSSFKTFVDRVLILNDAPLLRLFRLECYEDIDILHVCSWMRNIMRRNIFEIEVRCMTLQEQRIRPPIQSFVSEKLKVLKLDMCFSQCWFSLSNFFLPKLLILHLEYFEIIDDNVYLDDFFWSGLPCLEEFVISYCRNLWSVCVRSSSLRRLEIRRTLMGLQSRTIIIETPSLEYLSIDDNVTDIKLKINAPSLVEAQLCFLGIELVKILKRIPSLKTLDIFITPNLFDRFAAKLRVYQLPLFPKLTCLEVGLWLYQQHPSHLTVLVLLCEHAPNLASLIYGDKRGILTPEWKKEGPSDLLPDLVPKCLSSTLKVIDIYSYQMIDHAVTKYLLQYAMVLQTIRVHLESNPTKEGDAISRLMKIPIASSACKVIICRDL